MRPELSGIERHLDELDERLAGLAPFIGRPRADFDPDPYLRRFGEQVRMACQPRRQSLDRSAE